MEEPTLTLVPIVRLAGRFSEARLPAGGRIRLLLDKEKQMLASDDSHEHTWAIYGANYCLEFPGADGYGPNPQGERHKTAADFISALRMSGDGEPGYAFVFDATPTARFSRTWSAAYDIREDGAVMRADDGLVAGVLQLLGCFPTVEAKVPAFRTARRRFDHSFTREYASDRFVDWAISLEACFANGTKGNIGTRVATQAARLVPSRDRERTEAIVRAIYDVRNGVVHRGLLDDVMTCEAYARLAKMAPPNPRRYIFSALGMQEPDGDGLGLARLTVGTLLAAFARQTMD